MHCRIYLNAPLEENATVDVGEAHAKYLRQVMRLQVGDTITIFNGEGGEYLSALTLLSKNSAQCKLIEYIDVDRELPCHVHVIQAANRSEKIETVLQKATELGAASFQIINSERATFHLPDNKREKRLQRWQRIVIEAAEQSERTALPRVVWQDKLAQIEKRGQCFVLHPRDAVLWQDVRVDLTQAKHLTLAIGPEGGWTQQELTFFGEQGFEMLSFGARVMRTETAAPALLAAIQAVL